MNRTCYSRNIWSFLAVIALVSLVSAMFLTGRGLQNTDEYQTTGHQIEARLYLDQHRLEAVDRVALRKTKKNNRLWRFHLNQALEISSIKVGDEEVPFSRIEKKEGVEVSEEEEIAHADLQPAIWEIDLKETGSEAEEVVVEVSYSGVIYDTLKVPSFSREFIANQTTGLIGEEGVYLSESSLWYPSRSGDLVPFSLEVVLPVEYQVVSQGKLVVDEVENGLRRVSWDSPNPSDMIYLIAGKYEVEERDVDGVKIYAYFFPESRDLRDTYLTATDRYIRMYSELIGPYPYSKFAVVENFFETGYGMPSFTLLGSSVIRLPFIVYTSLGHEVLHNWWGNSVFVDSTSGNWCESLTTYMADYYYKEQRGADPAKQYRMEINKAYSNYVNANNDFSLAAFTSRTTPATRTVGYGKGAMVYHGLRRLLGDAAFFQALRNFFKEHIYTSASFDDLQRAFEKEGGVDLDWYFDQWIKGTGAPLLHLEVAAVGDGSPGEVEFVISQEGTGAPYRLDVPVILETSEGRVEQVVDLRSDRESFSFPVTGKPVALSVDPDFHLFRRMDPMEIPPSLSMILGDENELIVLPDRAEGHLLDVYSELVGQLNRTGKAEVKRADEVGEKEFEENSIFIIGGPEENSAWNTLIKGTGNDVDVGERSVVIAGESYPAPGHSYLVVLRSPYDPGRGTAAFFGYSEESVREAGRKLVHYGKYSYLVFEGGKNVAKGSWEVKDSPLTCRF